MTEARFRKWERLNRQTDFDRVHASDVFAADEVLVMRGCANQLDYARIGISISRKAGGAVIRNRWKRLIREAFRLDRPTIPGGLDFVVRPRRGARPESRKVRVSLLRLSRQIARRLGRNLG
jgi:ribonuclease P protein component